MGMCAFRASATYRSRTWADSIEQTLITWRARRYGISFRHCTKAVTR